MLKLTDLDSVLLQIHFHSLLLQSSAGKVTSLLHSHNLYFPNVIQMGQYPIRNKSLFTSIMPGEAIDLVMYSSKVSHNVKLVFFSV